MTFKGPFQPKLFYDSMIQICWLSCSYACLSWPLSFTFPCVLVPQTYVRVKVCCEGKDLCSKPFLFHVELGGACFLRRHNSPSSLTITQVGRLEIKSVIREVQQKKAFY